jgi:TolB-like protein/class 3 adenylate cyclase/cytochrome c-type biogenesis protein CcmH/NrfG
VDPATVERRLAAVLVADVVAYSRLVEADEANTLAAIRKIRSDVFGPLLSRHHGRVVKVIGDGIIAEFGSVVDAVYCAVAVQKESAVIQADSPAERRIVLRIGVNLGDVVVEGDDLLGDGVNIAARLEQLCPPGGVLVSGTAYDQLRGKLDLPLDFAGDQRVKNISQPIRTYSVRLSGARRGWRLRTRPLRRYLPVAGVAIALAIATGAATWWFQSTEPALAAKPSIAVLPFGNIGGDETAGRFADGITEDIITDLARYRDVDVIARNSTAAYEGKPIDIRQVGRDLNVRYVLEGSVQREADQVRITAQLIDAGTAAHIWSDRWDRPVTDLFALQAEISEQVANRLLDTGGVITTAEHVAARRRSPRDLTAYELYLRGREALHEFTREGVTEAISLLKQAVEKDPTLARAWDELGAAYTISGDFGADVTTAQAEALNAAERAIALDPMDALAHAHLAHILGSQGQHQRAKAEFQRALSLNPGSADILMIYVSWAGTFESPQRAAELVDQSIRLDPNYPTWATGPFSFAYVMAERYEDALRVLSEQSPDSYTVYSWVARAVSYAMLNRSQEAKLWVTRTLEKHPNLTIEGFLADPGWPDAERAYLGKVMRRAGFPVCAKPEQLKDIKNPVRLPECSAPVAP